MLYMHPQCPKQSGAVECGYNVMRFMHDIILSLSTSIVDIVSTSILKISSYHLFWIKLMYNHFIVHIRKIYLVHTLKLTSVKLDRNGQCSYLSTYIVLRIRFFCKLKSILSIFFGGYNFVEQEGHICKCLNHIF